MRAEEGRDAKCDETLHITRLYITHLPYTHYPECEAKQSGRERENTQIKCNKLCFLTFQPVPFRFLGFLYTTLAQNTHNLSCTVLFCCVYTTHLAKESMCWWFDFSSIHRAKGTKRVRLAACVWIFGKNSGKETVYRKLKRISQHFQSYALYEVGRKKNYYSFALFYGRIHKMAMEEYSLLRMCPKSKVFT